jgi:hypothetical protein
MLVSDNSLWESVTSSGQHVADIISEKWVNDKEDKGRLAKAWFANLVGLAGKSTIDSYFS